MSTASLRARIVLLVMLVVLPAALAGCGGSGGGGGSFDERGQLLAVEFPDPNDVNPEAPDQPPAGAPLVQQVVFTFSGRPDPNGISANTLQIRDTSNLPIGGRFEVEGAQVIFTPTLPLRAFVLFGSGAIDTGGTALQPGASYTVRVGPKTFPFVGSVAPSLRAKYPDPLDPEGVVVGFTTTSTPGVFFAGLERATPKLVSVDPSDGETGVSPNLYSDPDGLFPPRRSFFLTFDRPLLPGVDNVGDAIFQLTDLDDRPAGFPDGLPLGIEVTLIENELHESRVQIAPSGILPFGHLVAIDFPSDVKSLSEGGLFSGARQVATTFTIAAAPATPIHDALVEDFDTTARRNGDWRAIARGELPADWDRADSGVLQAAFAFQGNGVLGSFRPQAPSSGLKVIVLDTTRQLFPLPDGSTPEAPPDFEVLGGVFSFTDVDIPAGVVLTPIGPQPLVFTATGSVHVAGTILLGGGDGTPEQTYDAAILSIPGGEGVAGGGRGGEAHPLVYFPPGPPNALALVDPLHGGSGYGIDPADGAMKRIGGTGGQVGCLDRKSNGKYQTDQEIACSPFRGSHSDEKVPGGGGGSMYRKGVTPGLYDFVGGKRLGDANGIGNVLPDGAGGYVVRDDKTLACGVGGLHFFFDDGDTTNDFFGEKGQLTRLIGGQGGGGGASLTESYYCGLWCKVDADTSNDACCGGAFPPLIVDSANDARGGSAGAGGGALLIQALGPIAIDVSCRIDASGGRGLGGEAVGCSYWGGGGGGGAGGAIVLQSAVSIVVLDGAVLDVSGGAGDKAENDNFYFTCDEGLATGNAGDAGAGGAGLIQLQAPAGTTATVANAVGSLIPFSSWIDPTNTLHPVEFTPISVALSSWWDLGRVTQRPPASTNPFFTFAGLDAQGFVATDAAGYVVSPSTADVVCGYLGQFDPVTRQYKPGEQPRPDFIPPNATVKIEFQGASAIVAGSKEVDPATLTAWSPSPSIASGRQFLRWRITFDVTADGSTLSPDVRLPMVERLGIPSEF